MALSHEGRSSPVFNSLSQFKFPAFAASIRSTPDEYRSSPTYFTQDRERSGREDVSSVSSKGFVKPLESSGFFSRSELHRMLRLLSSEIQSCYYLVAHHMTGFSLFQ